MKTSNIIFCDIHVELLLEHQVKENILNEILNLCGLKFQDAYYNRVNNNNINLLRQPHFLTLVSRGRPYWMYCTKIEGKECCVLIEKFLKPGYPYPKMMIGKFVFNNSIYTNTLFECELTKINGREKEWLLLIQDLHIYQNTNMILIDPITRLNQLHYIMEYFYTEDMILQPCALQLKMPFSSKDLFDLKRLARELPYTISGIMFIPYNVQNGCLYWEDTMNQIQRNKKKVEHTVVVEDSNGEKTFQIKKSDLPGVYHIMNIEDKNISDTLHIPNLASSKKMKVEFSNSDFKEMKCRFNNDFNKWEPIL